MNFNLTKALAISAAALALSATAAQARTVIFADFDTGASNTRNFRFVNAGPSDSDSATLYTTATATATTPGAANVFFSFLGDPALSGFFDLASKFTFNGTVHDTPATFDGSTYTQTGINGNFKFVYNGVNNAVVNGFTLKKGVSVLLSGTFNNAWIQGNGGVGGLDVTVDNGGSALFTSAYYDLSQFEPGTFEYTFHLGGVNPIFGRANAHSALNSFRAHVGGEFQGAIPEPTTWALMITGFMGAGAMLRRQRRAVAVKA